MFESNGGKGLRGIWGGKEINVGGQVHLLMEHDLIDEYRLLIHPVVAGGGKRLFKENIDRQNLSLVETQTFKSDIVVLIY